MRHTASLKLANFKKGVFNNNKNNRLHCAYCALLQWLVFTMLLAAAVLLTFLHFTTRQSTPSPVASKFLKKETRFENEFRLHTVWHVMTRPVNIAATIFTSIFNTIGNLSCELFLRLNGVSLWVTSVLHSYNCI